MEHRIHVVIEVVDVWDICLNKDEYERDCSVLEGIHSDLPSSFSRNLILTMYGTKTLLICTQPDSFVSRVKEFDECECLGVNE